MNVPSLCNNVKMNKRGGVAPIPSQKFRNSHDGCSSFAVTVAVRHGGLGGTSQSQERLLSINRSRPSQWCRSSSSLSPTPSLPLSSPPPLPSSRVASRRTTAVVISASPVSDPNPRRRRCLNSTKQLRRCKALELSWEDAFREAKPEVWNQHYYFGESGRQTMVSETSAFASMGLHPADMLLSEAAMQTQMYPLPTGIKTPEGVFRSSDDSWLRNSLPGCSRIAIEVKRIAFHRIPDTMPSKYKGLYLRLGGWYAELVQEAVDQISPDMAGIFDIDGHVVFVAVPESMSSREVEQIRAELLDRVDLLSCAVPCVLTVQKVPDTAFARKLLSYLKE